MNHVGSTARRLLIFWLGLALLVGVTTTLSSPTAEAAFPGSTDWVVFTGTDAAGTGDLEIWAISADGSGNVINLTNNQLIESDPAFSADGSRLAFARDVAGSSAIYVAEFDPSGPSLGTAMKISNGPIDGEPTWSPGGTMIAYQRKIVSTMSSGKSVTADAANLIDSAADFVADGVAVGDKVKNLSDGSSGIATSVAETTITIAGGLSGGASNTWKNGDTYAIERAHRQLFKSPADGSNPAGTRLSPSGSQLLYDDQDPTWSPDGTLIAFTSTQDNTNADIFTMTPSGGARTNLTDVGTLDNGASRPSWSPDAQNIAFQIAEPNVADQNIYRMSRTGASPRLVTGAGVTGSDDDLEPAWSPDGARVAFRRGGSGGNKLYVINDDGSGSATRLGSATVPTSNSEPEWRPTTLLTDISGSLFESDILWLAGRGITKGCNPPANDRFCPDALVTRGQMAAFLVRFLGLSDSDGSIKFTDTSGSIFEEDIRRLATAGITKGCNPPANTKFCPQDTVTRGQMAAFLVRALSLQDDGGGDLFTDDDNSIFEQDIDRLATAGITKGCNPPANTRFCPTASVTRGQMAAFLHRAATLLL
jgi:Tol biopolymer transport system component